jgi:YD repeat-containing protein
MVSTYEEPPWAENYPLPLRHVIVLFLFLNIPVSGMVECVVIPAVNAPAQVDAWLSVVLNLLGSVAWWWMLARVSRWRRSRAARMLDG